MISANTETSHQHRRSQKGPTNEKRGTISAGARFGIDRRKPDELPIARHRPRPPITITNTTRIPLLKTSSNSWPTWHLLLKTKTSRMMDISPQTTKMFTSPLMPYIWQPDPSSETDRALQQDIDDEVELQEVLDHKEVLDKPYIGYLYSEETV
jgi:hypothetical protein